MTRLPIDGGRYGEALPSGAYAVMTAGAMVTHQGRIDYTIDEALYPRITEVGGFQIAGQAAKGGGCLHWKASDKKWRRDPRVSIGVSGHIFDQQGRLHVMGPGSSQGYRYVAEDGRLVLGDFTYRDAARNIFEYTTYGNITIGQGAESGCIALLDGKRYLIERGHCTFVRFNRDGDRLALAIRKQQEYRVILLWLTVDELKAFPLETAAPSTPTPAPTPTPKPEEPVADSYQLKQPELGVFQTVLSELGAKFSEWRTSSSDDDRRKLAKAIAQTLRARLGERWVWKSQHSNLASPSKDAVAFLLDGPAKHGTKARMAIFDMVNGSTRAMNLGGRGEISEQYVIHVDAFDHLAYGVPTPTPVPTPTEPPAPAPVPDPTPAPQTCGCEAGLKELTLLVGRIEAVLSAVVSQQQRTADALDRLAVPSIPSLPWPVTIDGGRFLGTLKGTVGTK